MWISGIEHPVLSIYVPSWVNEWYIKRNYKHRSRLNYYVLVSSLFTCFDAIPSLFYTVKAGKESDQVTDTFLSDFPT